MNELKEFGITMDVWEPVADPQEVKHEYGIMPVSKPKPHRYDVVVLAVKHKEFLELGKKGLSIYLKPLGVFYDAKEVMK
jgi:UDP-N-acetyl-D-galactosamine dehydrogenase